MSFQLRPLTPEDYPRMVEIMAQQLPEYPTVAELHQEDKIRLEGTILHRIAAVNAAGFLTGYAYTGRGPTDKPDQFGLSLRVDKGWRRQGIGVALYEAMERFAVGQGALTLSATVRESEPGDLAWAKHRGFAIEHHLFESTLDLAAFDPSRFPDAPDDCPVAGVESGGRHSGCRRRRVDRSGAGAEAEQWLVLPQPDRGQAR